MDAERATLIIHQLLRIASTHAVDPIALGDSLESYFLEHQDEWQWDGETWDGPFRVWTLREVSRA